MDEPRSILLVVLMVSALWLGGCKAVFGPGGDTVTERRAQVLKERDTLVWRLGLRRPKLAAEVKDAAGYAYFSTSNMHLLVFSSEDAYGVVTDREGRNTFMRMYGTGAGFGLGIKDFRILMIFKSKTTLDHFIANGMDVRGAAAAGVEAGDLDAMADATESVQQDVVVYQLTDLGGAFHVTLQANKFWVDDVLN